MFRQQQSIFFNVHNTGKPVPNTILQYFTCMDMLVGANVTVFASIRSRMLEMLARRCVNAGPFSCMYPQSTRSIVVPTLHTYSNLKGALKPATVQSQSRAYSTWAGSRLLFPDLLVLSLTLTRLVARVVMLYLLGKVAYSGTEHGCERVSHALILSPCFISYMSRSIVDEEFLYWRFRQFPGCDYFGNTRQSIC